MKIVVLGAGGRLGAALVREFRPKYDVAVFDHAQLDLSNLEDLREKVGATTFDVLINAAAFTNVDACETERDRAFLINVEAPGVLAEICNEKDAKLIHFSTDYVFDGEKRAPYIEEDQANPISAYGESKLAGEKNVLAAEDGHLVVRVSWVFGPDRPSFIDAMIKRAQKTKRSMRYPTNFPRPRTRMILPGCCRNFSIATSQVAFCISQMPVNAVGRNTRNGRWIAAVMPVFL